MRGAAVGGFFSQVTFCCSLGLNEVGQTDDEWNTDVFFEGKLQQKND
jgi:hypothetical protein